MATRPGIKPALASLLAAWCGEGACLELTLAALGPSEIDPMALIMAANGGHAGCVKMLARPERSEDQDDALRCAVRAGSLECVEILLATCACDPASGHSNHWQDLGFRTALEWAASAPKPGVAIMQALLDALALDPASNPGAVAEALALAAERRRGGMADLLLPWADGEAKLCAIDRALAIGRFQIAGAILESIDPQARRGSDGWAAPHVAAACARKEIEEDFDWPGGEDIAELFQWQDEGPEPLADKIDWHQGLLRFCEKALDRGCPTTGLYDGDTAQELAQENRRKDWAAAFSALAERREISTASKAAADPKASRPRGL